MISCERTPEIFRYELAGRGKDNHCWVNCIVEDGTGERVGYFRHPGYIRHNSMTAIWYEVKPGTSWLQVTPGVVRYLWMKGQEYAKRDGTECNSFGFVLGASHPAYEALGDRLPTVRDPYAWYLRVPDVRGFLDHIKPALEKRLEASIAAGHSRDICLSFYRSGLQIRIEQGRITAIESWKPGPKQEGDAAFPNLTFLQLIFGYRSYKELEHALADCWCNSDEVSVLLDILFPKKLSNVYPLA